MKKIVYYLSILILTLTAYLSNSAFAYTGFSALVVEPKSGKVIFEHDAQTRRYPASLTKIMTLYLVFEDLSKKKISMNQNIKISQRAAKAECSCLKAKPGTSITVQKAIEALVVQSSNDVSIAVAEFLGNGSEANFVARMNQTAKKLDMMQTNFTNPHGLPDDRQYTTAKDMATLAVAIYNHFPEYYPLFKLDSFYYNGQKITGHNRVNKRLAGADGIKTGYIRKSGSNLVTSAQRGNTRLFAVVIGGKNTKSRDDIMVNIMNDSFAAIEKNRRNPSISPVITEDLLVGYDPAKNPNPKRIRISNKRNSIAILESDYLTLPTLQLISTSSMPNVNPTAPASIQVGAFKYRKAAQDRARVVYRKLQQGKIDVVLIDSLYRARLSGFDYQHATAACDQIKSWGSDCLVVY